MPVQGQTNSCVRYQVRDLVITFFAGGEIRIGLAEHAVGRILSGAPFDNTLSGDELRELLQKRDNYLSTAGSAE